MRPLLQLQDAEGPGPWMVRSSFLDNIFVERLWSMMPSSTGSPSPWRMYLKAYQTVDRGPILGSMPTGVYNRQMASPFGLTRPCCSRGLYHLPGAVERGVFSSHEEAGLLPSGLVPTGSTPDVQQDTDAPKTAGGETRSIWLALVLSTNNGPPSAGRFISVAVPCSLSSLWRGL